MSSGAHQPLGAHWLLVPITLWVPINSWCPVAPGAHHPVGTHQLLVPSGSCYTSSCGCPSAPDALWLLVPISSWLPIGSWCPSPLGCPPAPDALWLLVPITPWVPINSWCPMAPGAHHPVGARPVPSWVPQVCSHTSHLDPCPTPPSTQGTSYPHVPGWHPAVTPKGASIGHPSPPWLASPPKTPITVVLGRCGMRPVPAAGDAGGGARDAGESGGWRTPCPAFAGPSVPGEAAETGGEGRRARLTSASGKLRSWAAACVPKTGGKKNPSIFGESCSRARRRLAANEGPASPLQRPGLR